VQKAFDPRTVTMKKTVGIALLALLVTVAAITTDLLTKRVFFGAVDHVSDGSLRSSIIQLTTHHNYGISFNIPVPSILLLTFSALVLGGILFFLGRLVSLHNTRPSLAIALLFGGAVGNFYDRLAYGYVRDWILLFERSAINIADLCIILGALWYLWLYRQQTKIAPSSPVDDLLSPQKDIPTV
jgi:signal peptidase II